MNFPDVFIKKIPSTFSLNSSERPPSTTMGPCWVGLVVSVSASHTVSREFPSRPGHTKGLHKNGTNCLPAWHAMR